MTPSALRAKLNNYLPNPAWPLVGFPLLEAWQPTLFTSPLITSGTSLIHVHLFALLAMAICPLIIALTVHRVIPVMAYRHGQTIGFGLLATLSTVCIWLSRDPTAVLPPACLTIGYVCAAACLT